ncbi:hypothetical protein D3C78_1692990 [compost metagenome]
MGKQKHRDGIGRRQQVQRRIQRLDKGRGADAIGHLRHVLKPLFGSKPVCTHHGRLVCALGQRLTQLEPGGFQVGVLVE